MMQECHETNWKRPLRGWHWLAAWIVLVAGLATLTRIVLALTSYQSYSASTALPWFLSLGIALAMAVLFGVLVRCLCSWRNFKRFLLGLVCLVGLVALFYAEEDIRGRLVWGRFKARWEAQGEKFDFAALVPPSIPDDQNFAMASVVATSYAHILDRNGRRISPPNTNVVNRLQMQVELGNDAPTNGIGNWQKAISSNLEGWQRYYRKLSLTTNLFPVAPQPQTPAADVLLALSKYDSTIEELRQAAALSGSRFPLNYDNGEPAAILLPHLACLKSCALVLRLRALAELEAGHSEAALADVSLAVRLPEMIRSEPFLISHLVRIALVHITQQAIWEGLAKHRWTEAQVLELERQLAGFDFVADYQAAMRGENACQVATTDFLRHRPELLDHIGEITEGNSSRIQDMLMYLAPSGWFYQNELCGSKIMLERFLPIADVRQQTISPTLAQRAGDSFRLLPRTPYTVLPRMLLPALGRSSRRFAFAQAAVNLARTACALERHRLAKGKYPETLGRVRP